MSCKSCSKTRTSSGSSGQPQVRIMNVNPVSELRDPPPRRPYQSQVRPTPLFYEQPGTPARDDLLAYYKHNAPMKKCMEFKPAACITAMPCDEKFLNTVLPDGNTIGYYLLRNRIASDQTNKIPYYDTSDPSIMWMTPNDYKY